MAATRTGGRTLAPSCIRTMSPGRIRRRAPAAIRAGSRPRQSCVRRLQPRQARPRAASSRRRNTFLIPTGGRNQRGSAPARRRAAVARSSSARTRPAEANQKVPTGWVWVWWPTAWPAAQDLRHELRPALGAGADQEKHGPGLVPVQEIQEPGRVLRVRSVVDRQADLGALPARSG